MSAGGGNEPNLTPFIDLFSVLICFLLMTAAWLHLDSMNTTIDKSTSSDTPDPTPSRPDKKVQLSVTIETNKVVFKENARATEVKHSYGGLDKTRVKQMLEILKKRYPDRKDMVVNTVSGVAYGSLISMYDLLIVTGWPEVGINPQ